MSSITMESNEKANNLTQNSDLGMKLSRMHGFAQIGVTIKFEAQRNLKKLIGMSIINTLICGLFLLINELEDNPPELSSDYATSFLSMISFIILITSILFNASIIVEDFEKQTGNLLFPKIDKDRLLIGRYLTRFAYASVTLIIFYLEIALLTYLQYDEIPGKLWGSLIWAIVYLHLVNSFVVLMSSLLNRIATTTVVSILVLLILFNMITSILMFTESTVEPLFILTYYSNIITAWFDMPDPRYREFSPFREGPEGQQSPISDRIFRQWSTPSVEGMILGVIIYSTILLTIAYLVYRVKQSKN